MKLLQKTISQYLLYSMFILLVGIPLFYVVIENIVRDNVDEELLKDKKAIAQKASSFVAEEIAGIRFIDENSSIRSSGFTQPFDSLLTKEMYDSSEHENIPARILRSNMLVNGKPYLLEIRTSLLETDDLVKSIVKVLALLLLLLLGGLLLINRNLSIRIWKPFYATLEKLRLYQVEKPAILGLSGSSVEEFSDLNSTLELLTTRARQAYESQKEFTENAAHELQTPLAILQGKLELLMQTTPLTAEQAGLIDELSDASSRMLRLNKSLILLSKIENKQFPETENVNLGEVVSHFAAMFAGQVSQKQLVLSVSINEMIMLPVNRDLFEILISNLLGNAIRHNIPGGSINIIADTHELSIRNTGRFSSLDKEKVFARFYKESSDSNSIGLGLEIARKICNISGYALNYEYRGGEHCFEVRFY